jgi:hypothetical protein
VAEGNALNDERGKETMEASNKTSTYFDAIVDVDNKVDEINLGEVDGAVNVNVTLDKKPVFLKDFPKIGGKNQVAYDTVQMTAKLYQKLTNIVVIIERKFSFFGL